MAYTPVMPNMKLSAQDMGVPDYMTALQQGLQGAADVYKPRKASEDLLAQMLSNKMNKPKAEHAVEQESLDRQISNANLSKLLQSVQTAKSNQDFLSGFGDKLNGGNGASTSNPAVNIPNQSYDNSGRNVSAEGPGVVNNPTAYNTFPGRRAASQQQTNEQPSLHDNVSQGFASQPGELPPGISLADAARAAKLQGMSTNFQVKDVNGRMMAFTPWGAKQVGEGLSAREKARQTGLGSSEAKIYESAYNAGNSLDQQNTALDQMIEQVANNPEARNVVGPFNQMATKYLGTPEQQKLLGQISTGSGDIMLAIAHDVKGTWSGKDMAMANGIKANPSDPFGVFLGKLQAHRALNELTKQRTDMIADLVYKGVAPHEAAKIAQNRISFAPIEKQVNSLLKTSEQYNLYMSHKMPSFSNKEEFDKFTSMLNPKQKLEFISKLGGVK